MNPLQQPFDTYAYQYDEHFTNTSIGRFQRAQVMAWLKNYITQPLQILEINCGTGEDGVQLAASGHNVYATDASAQMIEVARHRLKNRNLTGVIEFQQLEFRELKSNVTTRKFDLIFSNFGGLNCISAIELKQLSSDLARLLQPNGKLFLVVMGRKCKWEQSYFLLKGNFQKAFRRLSNQTVDCAIGNITFNTFYYSPAEIQQIFSDEFDVSLIKPVAFFIPPSYLQNFFDNKKMFLKMLGWMDGLVRNFSLLANHSDHYIIVLDKK